jgi:cysteinyl-tRNA synthetase
MDDDFNTVEAIAVLFDLANEVNRSQSADAAAQLVALGTALGLLQRDPLVFLQGAGSDEALIAEQILARNAAKQAKDYSEADRIRKALLSDGIVLEDSAQGTNWRRV